MCINPLRPEELINKRKELSDIANNTESETFANTGLSSSRGAAYEAVRNKEDDLELEFLEKMNEEDYFNDLFKRANS